MHAGQHLLSIQGTAVLKYYVLPNLIWVVWEIVFVLLTLLVNWPFSLPLSGSPVSHSRPGALLGERSKQLFPAAVIPVSKRVFHSKNWCLFIKSTIAYDTVYPSPTFSSRHVTIRRRGSARARQSTVSSAGARGSMSPMGWLSLSIPPPTLLDHLYLSVSQAALRSEVKDTCLCVSGRDHTSSVI